MPLETNCIAIAPIYAIWLIKHRRGKNIGSFPFYVLCACLSHWHATAVMFARTGINYFTFKYFTPCVGMK